MSIPASSVKIVTIGTLTILNTATDSGVFGVDDYGKYEAITIHAPAALTAVVTVQVATTDVAAPTFNTLQSPSGTDITVAATKSITLTPPCFVQFRLHSAGAEGADRAFTITGRLASVTSP